MTKFVLGAIFGVTAFIAGLPWIKDYLVPDPGDE